jgi:hypothetical protein
MKGQENITLTVIPRDHSDKYEIAFTAIAQQLIVDWGDDSAPETYPNVAGHKITHTYTNNATYTVQIKAERLTDFYCNNDNVTSLDVSGCTALESLDCSNNQLTSLNVSGCTALEGLECHSNQLTATVLNTVLTALPNRTTSSWGQISISNNPGAGTCNRVIAESKGWQVLWRFSY